MIVNRHIRCIAVNEETNKQTVLSDYASNNSKLATTKQN